MFGGSKRHRQANQPLTAATANPNAATAAASAFARRTSSSSLSSAAAAAALRANPTTPINVSEVQTKRTQRRSASVSSFGSQDTRRSLQRSPSQSSMTERSFRSPSPRRTPVPPENAPPVPTIPDDVRSDGGKSAHARATSLQMQPFRVASQKTKEGAGSWFGAATEGNMANVRTSDAPMRVASPESRSGAVSPTSSVNFSYPRGLHGASPPASPAIESIRMTSNQRLASPRRAESTTSRSSTSDQTLVYDPNSRRMVPKVETLATEHAVRDASEKPIKKKKQQHQALARSGSHLAKGTMGRVHGTAVQEPAPKAKGNPPAQPSLPLPENHVQQTSTPVKESPQPSIATQQTNVTPQQGVCSPHQEASPFYSSVSERNTQRHVTSTPEHGRRTPVSSLEPESPVVQDVRKGDGATILPHSQPRQGAPILGRKPSTVLEGSEDESSEDGAMYEPTAQKDVANVLDAVPVRSSALPKHPSLSSESTAVESQLITSPQPQPILPEQRQHTDIRNARAQSSSPARSARFSLTTDQLAIRHEPPPRSVSPRKSAMKHSASPSRGVSPTNESSESSGPTRLESEATVTEAHMARKKSHRVSFDDANTKIVGQSAPKSELDSPVVLSPQPTKRHWYNHLGRNRKKDAVALDDDEVMKPRPALPSFGSVREKKPRETEERPLVRPVEPPSPPGPNAATHPEDLGSEQDRTVSVSQSNDHNVGAILNQEQTARNAANISRFREPLPPVVTSMEGSGYESASSLSSEEDDFEEVVQEPEPTLPPEQLKEQMVTAHPELVNDTRTDGALPAAVDPNYAKAERDADVPSISVIRPTPVPRETVSPDSSAPLDSGYFDVPGGFPEEDSDENVSRPQTQTAPSIDTNGATVSHTDRAVSFAPSTRATTYQSLVQETESESEGNSIYSDAYEDLSEADGDGFMSLDAVITSPIPNKVSQKLYEKAMAAPPQELPRGGTVRPESDPVQPAGASQPEDDWERAKMYWRGLTSEKRQQLEQEVLEEAGVEGDLEEAVQPKKVKRKKSVRRTESTKEQYVPADPERVYQIQPGTKAVIEEEAPLPMRKTLRGRQPQDASGTTRLQKTMRATPTQQSSAAGSGMRKTLRSQPGAATQSPVKSQGSGGLRKSMRQNGASQPDATRTVSTQESSGRGVEDNHSKSTLPEGLMSSTEMAKAMHATLRRRGSDSSDTSFRRARPRREGFGFRSSMRSNAAADASAAGRNSRFSLRSASPPASPASPPVTMGTRMTMRTMRSDSSDGSTRRMRLPSFGKPSAKKPGNKPGNKSRFGDSSDEDGAGPSAFRSRFAESSDEDEASPLPAVPSTPKGRHSPRTATAAAMKIAPSRYDEKAEESPDLPDSSDDEPPVQQQKSSSPRKVSNASGRLTKPQSDGKGLQRSGSGRGTLVESSGTSAVGTQAILRPSHSRRGSFLSVLRRKKDSDGGKISRATASESAARTDTKLERRADELSALRGDTISPRLQKLPMENWPLVEETIDDDEKRPMTADNNKPMDVSRPVFVQRRSTNQVLTSGRPGELDAGQLDDAGKKKKKFGTLRRMFKLDD